ncbi:MAG: Rrf2 family transcriptional regulator [Bacteroidales bacterium]|nr:Rrf2 family transcriptional regulator [Bacteroidales bacterium]
MFSKETEYALRSLVYIQTENFNGRKPGTLEISREIDSPRFFTAKILQKLVRSGFIRSSKGRGGGFYFQSDKPELSLRDVIIVVEGEHIIKGCGFGLKDCNEDNPCPLHERYGPVRRAIEELVSTETIQSLAEKISQKAGIRK